MDAIEAMARAHWEHIWGEDEPWYVQPAGVRQQRGFAMRAALLALRDCEGLLDIAIHAGHVPSCVDVKAFRTMINAILEEG